MSGESKIPARDTAYLVLREIEERDAYANLALKRFLDGHNVTPVDARLAAEIVYGTARMRLALDCLLTGLLRQPLEQLQPEAATILRLSLYQLHYLDKVEAYAVTDEAVKLTRRYAKPALTGLVNAVLRNYLRQAEQKGREALLPPPDDLRRYLQITLSYPDWLVSYLLANFGPERALAICRAGNAHPGLWLRANTLRVGRDELAAELNAAGYPCRAAGYAPETLLLERGAGLTATPAFTAGRFLLEGPASQLVAHALQPQPGSRVIDLAAAPGGKTTHLAALMQNRGEIAAFDIHEHKTRLIRDNCRRLGVEIVRTAVADGAALPETWRGWADALLLDAPCSGLGVLAARADSRHHKTAADLPALAAQQAKMLRAAAAYVRPGGRLCYSTCTLAHEENEDNVRRFLADHPDYHLLPLTTLAGWLPPLYRAQAAQGMVQLLPDEQGMEGFFLALMEKGEEV